MIILNMGELLANAAIREYLYLLVVVVRGSNPRTPSTESITTATSGLHICIASSGSHAPRVHIPGLAAIRKQKFINSSLTGDNYSMDIIELTNILN